MDERRARQLVEALLFVSDSPLPAERVTAILEEGGEADIRAIVQSLNDEYEQSERCFRIIEVAGGFQFAARPEFAPWIKKLFRGRRLPRLSMAALETLAIIAFKGPLIRAEIEAIRGVAVEGVLKTLLERNLITVAGRQEGPGKPLLYATTQEFLIYFGLNSLADLPKPRELEELLRNEEAALGSSDVAEESDSDGEDSGADREVSDSDREDFGAEREAPDSGREDSDTADATE